MIIHTTLSRFSLIEINSRYVYRKRWFHKGFQILKKEYGCYCGGVQEIHYELYTNVADEPALIEIIKGLR